MRADKRTSVPDPRPETITTAKEAVRAERERMAGILHASTCQDVTAAYLMISGIAIQSRKVAPDLEQKLTDIAERLREAGEGLRKLLRSLESDEQPRC